MLYNSHVMENKEERFLPIGIQDFEDLRNRDCVYVDKTAYVYNLAREGKAYFLSRPRRFGKSLLLSTMEAYFMGKKELFHGLALEKLEKKWEVCPVIKISFGGDNYTDTEIMKSSLNFILSKYEESYEIKVSDPRLSIRLSNIIMTAYKKTGKQVAVIIDEYDKPARRALLRIRGEKPGGTPCVLQPIEGTRPIHPLFVHHGNHENQPHEYFQRSEPA